VNNFAVNCRVAFAVKCSVNQRILAVRCAHLFSVPTRLCCVAVSLPQINSVRDRLETIHRFRIQLLLSLHERFVVSGQAGAAATTSTTSSSWLFGGSSSQSADLAYQKSVREKFPFLELTNPVIFDTPAVLLSGESGLFDSAAAALNGKSGTVYTSLDYFMFYSSGGMLFASTPEIVAVPLRTVALMEVVDAEGMVISCRYAGDDQGLQLTQPVTHAGSATEGKANAAVTGTNVSIQRSDPSSTANGSSGGIVLPSGQTVPASARLPHSIRIVDVAGTTDVTVEVKGLTLDYCRRVGDLIDLIVRVSAMCPVMLLRCGCLWFARFLIPRLTMLTVLLTGVFCFDALVQDKLYVVRLDSPRHGATDSHHTAAQLPPKASLYQTIADIDDIRELLDLPNNTGVTGPAGSAADTAGDAVGGREDRAYSTDSLGSTSSEGSARLPDRAVGLSSASVEDSSLPSGRKTEGAALLPTPLGGSFGSDRRAPAGVAATNMAAAAPAVERSDSSHLLELEDFFSELNTGIGNITGRVSYHSYPHQHVNLGMFD
jgi:hypothetical protein